MSSGSLNCLKEYGRISDAHRQIPIDRLSASSAGLGKAGELGSPEKQGNQGLLVGNDHGPCSPTSRAISSIDYGMGPA